MTSPHAAAAAPCTAAPGRGELIPQRKTASQTLVHWVQLGRARPQASVPCMRSPRQFMFRNEMFGASHDKCLQDALSMCLPRTVCTTISCTELQTQSQQACSPLCPKKHFNGKSSANSLYRTPSPRANPAAHSSSAWAAAHPALWGPAAAILLQPSSFAAAHAAGNSATAGSPLSRCTCNLQPLQHSTLTASVQCEAHMQAQHSLSRAACKDHESEQNLQEALARPCPPCKVRFQQPRCLPDLMAEDICNCLQQTASTMNP